MKFAFYLMLWFFIAFVAAFDTYVNICHPVTMLTELNPIACAILHCSDNNFALLIAIKFFGTSIVLSVLLLGYFYRKAHAYCIASVLALVQLGVLLFLCFG